MNPNLTSGVRMPLPGERKPYVCLKCGKRFWSEHGPTLFSEVTVKCPECGSRKCTRDMTIVF